MLSPSDEAATAEIPYLHIVLHIRREESKAEIPPKWTICRETGQVRLSTHLDDYRVNRDLGNWVIPVTLPSQPVPPTRMQKPNNVVE